MQKKWILLSLTLLLTIVVNAQISGTVFRDFNADGTRTTTNPSEPLVASVIVNAYNAAGTLLASYTTTNGTGAYPYTGPNYSIPASGTYNGTPGSNTGGVPASTAVRLEFVLSATGCVADASDFSSKGSSSVQFVTAPSTTTNYAINNPADYNTGTTGVSLFTPVYYTGDPTGGGTAGTSKMFISYPYTYGSINRQVNGAQFGAVWGVAYSKQAKKVFTSAFMKRHAGYGPLGSGGIYLLTPTASSFNVSQFFDMDNNTFNTASNPITRTRADISAPVYGNGNSFTLTNSNQAINYNGSIDPISGFPSGLGVIGSNIQRGLLPNTGTTSYDGAAFDQVGKVGLGGIDISDDGKFLFVVNLYQRKLFRLELDDPYNPSAVISVSSYSIPAQSCTNGELRPFGVKYYGGKVFVGAVCTGEYETTNTNSNLSATVFELTNATGNASFNSSPVLNFPLTYTKGAVNSANTSGNRWYPWINDLSKGLKSGSVIWYAQPVLSDIDFTERGDMILGFADRIGHQAGNYNNYYLGGSDPTYSLTETGGDILIAGKNCLTGYTLENNGAYSSNGVNFSNPIASNGQGPGGDEFFYGDVYISFGPVTHEEISLGSMAILKGSNFVQVNVFDPINGTATAAGTTSFNTTNGNRSANSFQVYQSANTNTTFGKANGLGDIELTASESPLEIGNRVWNDTDADGIQDAGETGIAGITVNLYLGSTQVATTTTASDGTYYFNTANVTMNGATGLLANTAYEIRIPNAAGASKQAALGTSGLTGANAGANDLIDSDATLSGTNAIIALTTGNAGENNHSYDVGFVPIGSVGNYVWIDQNGNGLQDDGSANGINGVTVELWNNTTNTLVASSTTANDGSGNPGYYNFVVTVSDNYYVKFPTTNGVRNLSIQTTTAATDGNSDANPSTGSSPVFTINTGGTGTAKDNPTIDAGYTCPSGCITTTLIKN